MNRIILFAGLLCSALPTKAQELPRRSFLGIQMENLTGDVRKIIGLKDSAGVLIDGTVPGSTAEAAGFKKGDVLISINKHRFRDVQDAVSFVASAKSNTSFTYEVIRDKKTLTGQAMFKPYPHEEYAGLEVVYTQAKTTSGLQRIILSKPHYSGKYPLVVFIGGIGCYSLDAPFDTARSEVQLLNKLSRAGYATARLEKPGVGDNAGHSRGCNEIGFKEEADGYVAAIETLKKREDIDADKVYIIGHSMGGVFGPMVAGKTAIKGIIAYGTIGSNFIEYLAKTRRTIGEAYGWAPDETDAYIKESCECAFYYFTEHLTTEQVAARKKECREHVGIFDLRSRTYNDELYALNIPELWKAYNGKALFVWGAGDYISSEEDHKILAAAVNHFHKGNGTFATVQQADHGMNSASSFQEARTNPGRYNPEVGNVILNWLKRQS